MGFNNGVSRHCEPDSYSDKAVGVLYTVVKGLRLELNICLIICLTNFRQKKRPSISARPLFYMVRQEGVEPPTAWFVARYSIQLSYWRFNTGQIMEVMLLKVNKFFISL